MWAWLPNECRCTWSEVLIRCSSTVRENTVHCHGCQLTSWANAFNITMMQRLTTTDVRSVLLVVCALERKSHIELDEKRIRVGSGELLQVCGVASITCVNEYARVADIHCPTW